MYCTNCRKTDHSDADCHSTRANNGPHRSMQMEQSSQAVEGALERLVRRLGPILTDQDGNLQKAILMCAWGDHRCANYSVHDWHYEYCAGLPDTAPALRPGLGGIIHGHPGERCPCMTPKASRQNNVSKLVGVCY